MLSHQLILDAAEQVVRACQPVGLVFMQRRVRVRFATAGQLLDALTAIGVLAATQPKRAVLADAFDREAVLAATHRAVAEGRVELDDDPCADCPGRIEPLDRDALRAAIATGSGGSAVPQHIRAAIHAGHIGQVVIFCDGCGVEEEGDYTGETREIRFAAARRWLAENKCWLISPSSDHCPSCVAGKEV